MKKVIFWTLNICYAMAILICFIVNVAVNQTLSWFFIVLTSIGCAYTFCPTITWIFSKYKMLVFIFSTFFSMFLLFLTFSIYKNIMAQKPYHDTFYHIFNKIARI